MEARARHKIAAGLIRLIRFRLGGAHLWIGFAWFFENDMASEVNVCDAGFAARQHLHY